MSVEALLAEREGYRRRGLANRVAQVDAQLAALGFAVADETVETATVAPPETVVPRRGRPRQED